MKRSLLLLAATILPSCGGGSPAAPSAPSSPTSGGGSAVTCTAQGEIAFVRDTLLQYYFWYKQLPDPDVKGFSTPEAYLEAVRYKPLDTTYSYITSQASSTAFYSDSQYIGFGLSYKQTGDLEMRVTQAYPGSPVADVGLDRGHYLVSIGGRTIADLIQTGDIATIFGPDTIGYSTTIAWRAGNGPVQSATVAKRLVTIPTVSQTGVYDVGSARVGYIHFRNFVTPSTDALTNAFQQLKDQGATDLVMDLRYNGGGLLSVAQHLASLIAGAPLVGKTFVALTLNDKQSAQNQTYAFQTKPQALAVPRLVVIATRGTASASETIINGLRPYMDVKVVGDTTYGKPVGQFEFDFCDKVLYPVVFQVLNANGTGDYFTGIPADCAAADDIDHALADPNEASLAEALSVMRTGHCSGQANAALARIEGLRARVREIPTDGWRRTINAW